MSNVFRKMFSAINSLYKARSLSRACIKINNIDIVFFLKSGVKQGDPLVSLCINSLANNINNEHCGVKTGIDFVGILLYVDDIVLLSGSPYKHQQYLSCLHKWCINWKVYTSM